MDDLEQPIEIDAKLRAKLQTLRVAAQNKRLDMTDAFSEFAGAGNLARDANLGLMPKNRFRAAMGGMFKGTKVGHAISSRLLGLLFGHVTSSRLLQAVM